MKFVVIGGTGLIGSKVVTELNEHGHQAIAASPNTGVNTLTGEGLTDALTGAQVVVDVSNSPSFEDGPAWDFFTTATGNLLTAAVKHTNYFSIGASTATFAALGIIAGLQVARRLRLRTRPGYWWVPIGAGLGMFAMTGVGPGTDYHAHLFGLGFGLLIGVGSAIAQLWRGWRAPRPFVQALLGAVALGAVVGSWALAFRHPY